MKIADGILLKISMFRQLPDPREPSAIGESLSTWTLSCTGSVRVELSGHRTSE